LGAGEAEETRSATRRQQAKKQGEALFGEEGSRSEQQQCAFDLMSALLPPASLGRGEYAALDLETVCVEFSACFLSLLTADSHFRF
jgi:hypothetical protein